MEEASPLTYIEDNENLSPFAIFVTSMRPDAVAQSIEFNNAIKKEGGNSLIFVVPNLTHKDMSLAMSDENSIIARTILKRIKEGRN